jgi:hypothetical protein
MHAIPVELSRDDIVEIAVPDILGTLWQGDTLDFAPAMAIEQAKFDFLGVGRE